jgi:NADP-dependent 3-hydroxy acid dehydrogenase YdfG
MRLEEGTAVVTGAGSGIGSPSPYALIGHCGTLL